MFASRLGPAEVAAWVILGSVWDLFYSVTSSIGDAAELRVAYHLGNNDTFNARLAAYKSLLLSMCVATVVSFVYFTLQYEIPAWFTIDRTLQAMLEKLMPFVGMANLTMQFGCTSWSIIGAMGQYKLATWVSFISSWGITMPAAAIFTIWLHLDLQGLTAAVVWGYVCTGATLSFVLLSTDWDSVAGEIQKANATTVEIGCSESVAPKEVSAAEEELLPVDSATVETGVDESKQKEPVVDCDNSVLFMNKDGSLIEAEPTDESFVDYRFCGSIEVRSEDVEEMTEYWKMAAACGQTNDEPLQDGINRNSCISAKPTTLGLSSNHQRNTRLLNLAPRSAPMRRWHQRRWSPKNLTK